MLFRSGPAGGRQDDVGCGRRGRAVLIFELARSGRRNAAQIPHGSPAKSEIPAALRRTTPVLLPEVPPDVASLFAPPEVLSVAPPLVTPADDVLPPGAAPLSSGVCLVEADEELAPPDVPLPLCSALPPPPRLQPARLIVTSPRINSIFDLPRLDLITIPFESGCVNLWRSEEHTSELQSH